MRFALYLLRWQLSTPVLAACMWVFRDRGDIAAAIASNFVGGCLFYFVDKAIFGGNNEHT